MRVSSALILATILSLSATPAVAQLPSGYSPISSRVAAPVAQPASGYERSSGRSNPALNFFSGSKSAAYTPQSRPVPLPPPLPVQTTRIGKPFSGVQQTSGISPYLALDAREGESSLPNYHLFVRPQLEQQQMNQVQQAQYRRLQQQVRKTAASGTVTSPSGGIPTTGHSAQFMELGGYYPGLQR